MRTPAAGTGRRRLLASLLATCALVAGVAVVGWLLLLLLRGTVVLVAYALGIAMIAVPLLLARRVLTGHPRREQRRRRATIGTVVVIGAVLCALAHLVDEHGWTLVVIPAAAVVLARLARAGGDLGRRLRRR
jgi:O-antigen/teichoic acid export membrane protein